MDFLFTYFEDGVCLGVMQEDRGQDLEARFPQDLFNCRELVRIFTCPLCSRLASDVALFQCCKGHVICAHCVPRSQRCCPRCRQRMTATRNLWMENAARFLFAANQLQNCQGVENSDRTCRQGQVLSHLIEFFAVDQFLHTSRIADMSFQLNGNVNGHQPRLATSSSSSSPVSPGTRSRAQQQDSQMSRKRLVNYESLLRLFECPSCRDWISAPIAQCRKGHVICSACRTKGGKSCPCCKQSFTEVPNLMMEQVAALIAFPCRFQPHGCFEFVQMSAKAGHEAFCPHRPVQCQYSSRGCRQEMQFHLMEQHVQHCAYRTRIQKH